ncbi:MAG: hypothetical protein GY762_04305 [Proteobacteria bacterium]|nr:hypothetical protein [Pseudomonadota bacterium]
MTIRKIGRRGNTTLAVIIGMFGSLSWRGGREKLKKSLKRANATTELLARSGLESRRLHAFGFGGTSPLESLRAGRERVAVLIVPTVPE